MQCLLQLLKQHFLRENLKRRVLLCGVCVCVQSDRDRQINRDGDYNYFEVMIVVVVLNKVVVGERVFLATEGKGSGGECVGSGTDRACGGNNFETVTVAMVGKVLITASALLLEVNVVVAVILMVYDSSAGSECGSGGKSLNN